MSQYDVTVYHHGRGFKVKLSDQSLGKGTKETVLSLAQRIAEMPDVCHFELIGGGFLVMHKDAANPAAIVVKEVQ